MVRLLIYALYSLILSMRFIPLHLNQSILRKRFYEYLHPPQIEVFLFIIVTDPIDASIVFFILANELFQVNSIKCCLPGSTSFVSFSTVLIKILSFGCLLLCLYQLSPTWLTFIRIILSGDIETNPGDFVNSFFSFCNWNLNSLAKDDFYRVKLLEAHNSIHNYDFISICGTSLNDTVDLPNVLLENYTFVSCNNPSNTRNC